MGPAKHVLPFTIAALLLAGACNDEPALVRLPDPVVQVDELKQKPAALVDILWVVDNSGTMVEEQAALAQNFDRFITGLTTCQGTGVQNDICDFDTKTCRTSGSPCNPPDYHIGVVSTDVRATLDQGKLRRVGLCVPAAGATPSDSAYRYCQGSNTHCAHDPNVPSSRPENSVCDMQQSIAFVTPTTPGAPNAFARAVQVGVAGSGLETGIRAAAMALGRDANRTSGEWAPAPLENQGFVRPDASLFIIFVSDEDDASFGEVTYFYRAFETLKGAGNEASVSVSAIVADPDVDGPQGPNPGGCTPAGSVQPNEPGTRYVQLAMYSRGLTNEFRVCDDKRLLCPAGSGCQYPITGLPGVCVTTNACTSDQNCGNFKCGDNQGCITCSSGSCQLPADRLPALLENNGIFGSICSGDYGEVLGPLGFEAAGLARKFELTRFPDCATEKVKCCPAGVADDACSAEAVVCVKVNGEVIPNERASGWVYESGSNAIFFDGSFVPPTDAAIEVSYRISRTDKALSCEGALQ